MSPRKPNAWSKQRKPAFAFTILELLVSVAVLAIILAAMLSLLNMTSTSYTRTAGKLEAFEAARTAFETFTRTLGQATLLSRLGYDDPTSPQAWQLRSDLQFISGSKADLGLTDATDAKDTHAVFFQAPLGVASSSLKTANALLNATGFFLAWGEDPTRPTKLPGKIPDKKRFRLFQYIQPRENLEIYNQTLTTKTEAGENVIVGDQTYDGTDWFAADVDALSHCHVLAENVILLAILPIAKGSPASAYLWNSRDAGNTDTLNRLPQALRVIMVAIDEASMARLGNPATAPSFLPAGLFDDPSGFEDIPAKMEAFLSDYQPPLNYRIFQADIPLNPSNTNL